MSFILAGAFLTGLLFLWRKIQTSRPSGQTKSIAIVVLGDFGRSPRMMYHARSFVQDGWDVNVVAYAGAKPLPGLLSNPRLHFHHIPPPPSWMTGLPQLLFLLCAPLKAIFPVFFLIKVLCWEIEVPPGWILVQNPPSIPTLPIAQFTSFLRGSRLIIDWHNTSHSILAIRLGQECPAVRFVKWFESYFGRNAAIHLFVTNAMKESLSKEWDLEGRLIVFYDRPPKTFHRLTTDEMHKFFSSFSLLRNPDPSLSTFLSSTPTSTSASPSSSTTSNQTPFTNPHLPTALIGPNVPNRPALIVSSTSWTADEDFKVLIEALRGYEKMAKVVNKNTDTNTNKIGESETETETETDEEGWVIGGKGVVRSQRAATGMGSILGGKNNGDNRKLPRLLMIITGKGPGKEAFEKEIRDIEKKERWDWVRCRTVWLERGEYPMLLGSADLGISLHTSSSGYDLPMKVVDMFGCGLPVLSLDFPSIGELVEDGKNGHIFKNGQELQQHLIRLLSNFEEFGSPLQMLHASFDDFKRRRQFVTEQKTKAKTKAKDDNDGDDDEGEMKKTVFGNELGSAAVVAWSWEENWNEVIEPLVHAWA